MSGPRSTFVDAAGVRLHAALHAPASAVGNPVVLLHGFTGTAESMAGVARPLSADRAVACLELVGHGESEAPADVARYAMEACVEQLVAALVALELPRPHLVGYSMGGRTALSVAVAHPDRFASLTLVGATAGIADPSARRERIATDEVLADRIEAEGVEAFVDHWMALPIFASQKRLGEAALARARADRLRSSARGLANSLRGMGAGAQPPVFDRLDRFTGPVLLVVGEEDAKFRALADALAEGLAEARIEVVAGAGHAAHLEAPEIFVDGLRAFLDEVDARPSELARSQGGDR